MKVRWLKAALNNLERIAEYIGHDNTDAARTTITRIRDASIHLSSYPEMGCKGRVHGTRELIIPGTPYIIIYRICNNSVEILRVFHSKQKSPEYF